MKKKWVIPAVFFAAGLVAGVTASLIVSGQFKRILPVEIREGQYQFVNPLLECEDGGVLAERELASFHSDIENLIREEIKAKKARSVAVYFRDLNNGPWFGIDEDEQFIPASLLKIPLMMGYFKRAETDPGIFKQRFAYTIGPEDVIPNIRPMEAMEPGRSYTVEDLIRRMIVHSDNNAARLLLYHDKEDFFDKAFKDLGLVPPDPDAPEYGITVKTYASFFRILYNASYLNKEMSNRALELLANVYFQGGLVAGVPEGVTVAHKFGERTIGDYKQFHDCGIVYYPERPYLLCVMSRGDEMAHLVSTVQDVSQLVFTEVDRQMRGEER